MQHRSLTAGAVLLVATTLAACSGSGASSDLDDTYRPPGSSIECGDAGDLSQYTQADPSRFPAIVDGPEGPQPFNEPIRIRVCVDVSTMSKEVSVFFRFRATGAVTLRDETMRTRVRPADGPTIIPVNVVADHSSDQGRLVVRMALGPIRRLSEFAGRARLPFSTSGTDVLVNDLA